MAAPTWIQNMIAQTPPTTPTDDKKLANELAQKGSGGGFFHDLTDPNSSYGGFAQMVDALKGGGGGGGTPSGSNLYNSLLNEVTKGLTYGQEMNQGDASTLAKTIWGQLQGLSPKEAATILGDIPTGTSLATDITNLENPQSSAQNQAALNFGFDPLSLGQMFSKTLAPWLSSQEKLSDIGISNFANQMNQALAGASPQLKADYAVAVPAMQEAESQQNQAVKEATATAPEWDSLIAGITNATQAAKLAQAAAQAEPYWAATTGTGAVPTGAANTQAQTYLQQLLASQH